MKDLPKFRPRRRETVIDFISEALTNYEQPLKSQFVRLVEYEDGHYRALFDPAFFTLPPGQSAPTKSQWNNLKKKMKRRDKRLFIFKEHGEADCDESGGRCYYIDFGFFAQ